MGLLCADTRFLSRLELQVQGRSPVLLSSTAEKGFALSVLCTNPHIQDQIEADTIGIERQIVLNGALFEELKISNYSTAPIRFQVSLSFNADFADLFEVRGRHRQQRGQRLRLKAGPKDPEPGSETEQLNLAYQGLDQSVMESRIQFCDRLPDQLQGYTAIWDLELASHASFFLTRYFIAILSEFIITFLRRCGYCTDVICVAACKQDRYN